MPVLDNLKHERFANHIAAGMTQAEAYKCSGFNAKHVDSAACKLAGKAQVAARIEELKRRITNKAVTEAALTKELILRTLWENVQEARSVKGGSAVVNRGCELIGKELGMFRDPVDKPPVNLEDLPPETLQRMLEQAEAAAAQGGDAPAPPKVN
jgi:hypothetical protein